jgi:hypothetical protein
LLSVATQVEQLADAVLLGGCSDAWLLLSELILRNAEAAYLGQIGFFYHVSWFVPHVNGLWVRVSNQKVDDLFGSYLLLEGSFNALFGQDSKEHVWELLSWFQEHLQDLLVKFVLGVRENSEVRLNYNKFLGLA